METKEVIRNYWDYRSETYSTEIVEQSEEEWATWKNMLSSTVDRREHLEILDVGTGPGQLALMFAEMGHHVTAVDLSTRMLDKARKNALKKSLDINFIHGDAEDLQFPDMQFDVVSSKFLLWTLPDPQKALSEWKRVLKKDGMIIAIDGDWFNSGIFLKSIRAISDGIRSIKERNFHNLFNQHYNPIKNDLPLYSLKPDQVFRFFNDAGFENINIERTDYLCRSRKKVNLPDKLDYASPIYFIKAVKK
ncbi:class I SAM-dependent methyltransferase [Methanosarcina barkeri]|uniref:SAM-dependent methyltransferase n=1 Tax=Methanosarcina barkeri CM1 TaxID=796385 RepID=A0A0G3C7P4_METBA|nr:class I SAM-dependent methyltransferase [Methanosarcina barkeri]AKJ38029.1 SAM-dependent methyltransferase [Methanosarcina barkeri CM1]